MKIKTNMIVWTTAIVAMLLINSLTEDLFAEEKYQSPDWIKTLIEKEETGEVANPPAFLSRCKYKGRTVYYRSSRCCDIPGILYDENGNVICSPDGGLTGRGDGRCADFHGQKRECEIIWRDTRTRSPLQKK